MWYRQITVVCNVKVLFNKLLLIFHFDYYRVRQITFSF